MKSILLATLTVNIHTFQVTTGVIFVKFHIFYIHNRFLRDLIVKKSIIKCYCFLFYYLINISILSFLIYYCFPLDPKLQICGYHTLKQIIPPPPFFFLELHATISILGTVWYGYLSNTF